jgi:hypothetical protein
MVEDGLSREYSMHGIEDIIFLSENLMGKRPLERPLYRREDNITMALRGTGQDGVDWIQLAQDREQWGGGSCEHNNEPSASVRSWEVLG